MSKKKNLTEILDCFIWPSAFRISSYAINVIINEQYDKLHVIFYDLLHRL